jgi:hypothetical protein
MLASFVAVIGTSFLATVAYAVLFVIHCVKVYRQPSVAPAELGIVDNKRVTDIEAPPSYMESVSAKVDDGQTAVNCEPSTTVPLSRQLALSDWRLMICAFIGCAATFCTYTAYTVMHSHAVSSHMLNFTCVNYTGYTHVHTFDDMIAASRAPNEVQSVRILPLHTH